MKAKPRGLRYRNLSARDGAIYYERVWQEKRICFSTKTDQWDEAAAVRDLYEERKGIGRLGTALRVEAPMLAEFAERYLEEDTGHLAPTTRVERKRALAKEGPILPRLSVLPLDEVVEPVLRAWWAEAVDGKGLTTKTGRNFLDALSGVFAYARELGLVERNPVDEFRRLLSRKTRTRKGRAESDPSRDVRPIEDAEEIEKLVEAARGEGIEAHVFVLLMLDAGLRVGEALGLRWRSVVWGEDENDRKRSLFIDNSRPRGGESGPPKGGRPRRVQLSRRLRGVLQSLYRRRERPAGEAYVLQFHLRDFRDRGWARLVDAAKIGHRRPKDLRDTFASQLLSAGVQLGYVSTQLGHADFGVTVRHYAKWVGGDEYREPLALQEGEVPADLLARLAESHQSPRPEPRRARRRRLRDRDDDSDGAQDWTRTSTPLLGPGPQPGVSTNFTTWAGGRRSL